jgi:hypothetical protein
MEIMIKMIKRLLLILSLISLGLVSQCMAAKKLKGAVVRYRMTQFGARDEKGVTAGKLSDSAKSVILSLEGKATLEIALTDKAGGSSAYTEITLSEEAKGYLQCVL